MGLGQRAQEVLDRRSRIQMAVNFTDSLQSKSWLVYTKEVLVVTRGCRFLFSSKHVSSGDGLLTTRICGTHIHSQTLETHDSNCAPMQYNSLLIVKAVELLVPSHFFILEWSSIQTPCIHNVVGDLTLYQLLYSPQSFNQSLSNSIGCFVISISQRQAELSAFTNFKCRFSCVS